MRLAFGVHIENFNIAFKHEKEVNTALAALEQTRAFTQPLFDAVIGHAICSINTKPRKRLCFSRVWITRVDPTLRFGYNFGNRFGHRASLRHAGDRDSLSRHLE